MPKYPKYKYEFQSNGQAFLLAVGESATANDGTVIKVHKFVRDEPEGERHYNTLWISFDGGKWVFNEQGQRTQGGQYREDFKRFEMGYPEIGGNIGVKIREVKYNEINP